MEDVESRRNRREERKCWRTVVNVTLCADKGGADNTTLAILKIELLFIDEVTLGKIFTIFQIYVKTKQTDVFTSNWILIKETQIFKIGFLFSLLQELGYAVVSSGLKLEL